MSDSDEGLRVAIIGTRGYPSYYGGFETAVRKIAPYLCESGWDVTVYGRHGTTQRDDLTCDRRVHSVQTIGLQRRSLSTLSYGLTSSLHAAASRPDVALVMNVANGFFLPLLKSRGVPAVVNVDGIEWERDKWSSVGKTVFRAGARATAKYGTALIADSKEIGRRWLDDFEVDSSFIPYGGDLREPLPLQDDVPDHAYILYVARFVPENSFEVFLDAARHLSRDYTIVFVGSDGFQGELDQRVQQLAETAPNAIWLGQIHDDDRLHALWQHAAVYFHGHSVGGTNPALVQAMMCGVSIVARDTPYNREVLGETGKFVPPESKEIVRAVRELMEDGKQREVLKSAAIDRAKANYTWESVCKSYDDLLRHVVQGS